MSSGAKDQMQGPGWPEGDAPARARVLMLGMGWFPASIGGLDRYYRALFEQLPEARGVLIGPATGAPAQIAVVARASQPLPRRLLAYWRAAQRASAEVDVVDAHFALYALAALSYGALRRRPAVFHFHGPWSQEGLAAGDLSPLRLALRRRIERSALRRADAHVVLSSAFRRLLVERYRLAPWSISVIAPGVALERFSPAADRAAVRARLQIGERAFVAVCARRLIPRMGVEVLLEAWGRLEGSLPGGSVLLVIGDGPLRGRLLKLAARGPLAGRTRVLGAVSDAELVEAYRAADVAVVPSLALEGFGMVVLEAAACGTPSLVSDVGGLPEAAAPLDRSLLLAPGDAEALAARLQAAAEGALPSRERTRRYAEGFDWGSVAERHRSLYLRLAGGQRDQRPRVVYLDHVARLSGGEIALLRLLPHFRGVNAHVILGEEGPLVERLQQAGVSVEVLPVAAGVRELRREAIGLAGAPLAGARTLAYVGRLALRLRELRPDLVHSNSLKSGVYGSLAARAAGTPLLWHLRDRVSSDYLTAPSVHLVRALTRHLANGVLANSAATLQTLSLGESGPLRAVIPDSVELSPYPPSPDAQATTFGMLGRIAPWKGQDLFLRAFAAAFPDGAERAVVVGKPMFGEEGYERDLHALADELGLGGRVEFRGFREDIWRELARFDVLVHASVIPEPFGQVVLEGMAAGVAVIAPDEGSPSAMIVDGETGRLFRIREAASLAGVMRELRDDPAARAQLGESARRAVGEYHPDALARRIEGFYEQLLAAAGRRRRERRPRS